MWFIGVEVEQETSAPPPKKILDPPLTFQWKVYERGTLSVKNGTHIKGSGDQDLGAEPPRILY